MNKDTGGPAFPVAQYDHMTFKPGTVDEHKRLLSGMTLRDYFAAKAMQGICVHNDTWGLQVSDIADAAYEIADAMLAARDQP